MSIDTWVAGPIVPAHPCPLTVIESAPEPEPRAAEPPAESGPASVPTFDEAFALSRAGGSRRAIAAAHRARSARRLVLADALVALLAAGAGIVAGYAQGSSVPELTALVAGVNLFWFLRLWVSRPLALPPLRLDSREVRRVLVTAQLVYGPLLLLEVLFPPLLPNALIVVSGPVALGGALLARAVLRRGASAAPAVPTLVVGGYASAAASARSLLRAEAAGARVVGACLPETDAVVVDHLDASGSRVPVVGTDRGVVEAVRETGAGLVVLTPTDALGPDDIRELMWQLAAEDVELVVTAGLPEVAFGRMAGGTVGRTPMVHVAPPRPRRSFGPAKRILDLAVAGAGIAVAAPVMAAIAVAIKLDSRGPVLYRAERVGAGGELFDMIKFRSMYVDADARRDVLADENMGAGPLFKVKDDPRVTRVGRFIRRYSLDELPQFFNVLGGSMSVVGPRPALAHEVEQYPPVMLRRLLVKPGVTGAWQVSGRSDLSWDESIQLDVGYVENWSLGTDVGIIARTVRTVVDSDGAY